MIKKIK